MLFHVSGKSLLNLTLVVASSIRKKITYTITTAELATVPDREEIAEVAMAERSSF